MAPLAYVLLEATEVTTWKSFLANKEVDKLANHTSLDLLVSSDAAVAGVTMSPPGSSLLASPLMALALIPSAAMAGVAAAAAGHCPSREWPQTAWGRKTTRTQASVLCLNV